MPASVPYHEPSFLHLLINSLFLIAANVTEYVLDRFLYCGLIGPLFVGVAWGTPGAGWLSRAQQECISQLGYLGLILVVYEGGLTTPLPQLLANVTLSTLVALTGVLLPIAFSFVLKTLVKATSLQAFAAGAALCSTSLGTAFTVLTSSGLDTTRLGTILTSSAMLDDVVGLVMLQVISNLGSSKNGVSPLLIVRPVVVSIGFLIIVFAICRFFVRPLTAKYYFVRQRQTKFGLAFLCDNPHTPFVVQTGILIGLIAVATYAQTSNLFAAYVAGICISWWDALKDRLNGAQMAGPRARQESSSLSEGEDLAAAQSQLDSNSHEVQPKISASVLLDSRCRTPTGEDCSNTGVAIFAAYFRPVLKFVLRPFFFASLGFAIPITKMFQGTVVWKGLIYTVLMFLAKITCGLWLIRWPLVSLNYAAAPFRRIFISEIRPQQISCVEPNHMSRGKSQQNLDTRQSGDHELQDVNGSADSACQAEQLHSENAFPSRSQTCIEQSFEQSFDIADSKARTFENGGVSNKETSPERDVELQNPTHDLPSQLLHDGVSETIEQNSNTSQQTIKPKSSCLYPVAILGSAMVARGEIGLLISSVAQTKGIFLTKGNPDNDENLIFLTVTWAILLCTVIGPIVMGGFVRRVRAYAQVDASNVNHQDMLLGIWGEVNQKVG